MCSLQVYRAREKGLEELLRRIRRALAPPRRQRQLQRSDGTGRSSRDGGVDAVGSEGTEAGAMVAARLEQRLARLTVRYMVSYLEVYCSTLCTWNTSTSTE